MRTIVKNREPASLTTHRNTPHCNFDNYADKDALRAALRDRRYDSVGRSAVRPATERGSEPEFEVDQKPAKSDPRRGAPLVAETARIGIEAALGSADSAPQFTAARSIRAGRDLVAGAEAGSERMMTAVADPRDSPPRAPA